jgi:hypothetical protein
VPTHLFTPPNTQALKTIQTEKIFFTSAKIHLLRAKKYLQAPKFSGLLINTAGLSR